MKEWDVFDEIIDLGKRRGFISHDEIQNALPQDFISEEELEDFINLLHDMGIKVTSMDGAQTEEDIPEEKEKIRPCRVFKDSWDFDRSSSYLLPSK